MTFFFNRYYIFGIGIPLGFGIEMQEYIIREKYESMVVVW